MGELCLQNTATARVYELARRAARSQLPILVLGETGTGKEVLAHAVHRMSSRSGGPFRAINCGSLPPTLMESVLFGHEKGAYTGAEQTQAGLFEQTQGGTLLLDEIGELSAAAQAALLRVVDTKTVTRIGAREERPLDVRIIAATHRDLGSMCALERFRTDLLHRLNAVTLTLPPLRERCDEIPAFVEHFLAVADLPAGCPRRITPEALSRLLAYSWPGNLRELRNAVERAAVLAIGDVIELADLPETLRPSIATTPTMPLSALTANGSDPASAPLGAEVAFKERLQRYELGLIRRALAQARGHRTNAAKLLNMPLRTFMKRMKSYEVDQGAELP